MAKTTVNCPECGAEILVERPGQKVAAVYMELGFSNGVATEKLTHAIDLVEIAALDMPFHHDLALVARLLRAVEAEIVAISD